MFKSIADVFNSPEARFNDPLYEIHNPVQSCDKPYDEDYKEFYNNLNPAIYPHPVNKMYHNTINPSHGVLKPIINK